MDPAQGSCLPAHGNEARARALSNASTVIINGSVSEVGRDLVNVESGAQVSFSSYYLNYGSSTTADPDYLTLKQLLDWLTMTNFRSMLQDHLAKRTPGTGKAFVTSTRFRAWLQKQCSALWAYGMPGAGKTILASIAIEYLQEQYLHDELDADKDSEITSSDIMVCFAYCRYSEPISARDILAALLRQAVERHARIRPIVQRLYSRHYLELTKPSYDELSVALAEAVKSFRIAFCILDGFDEVLEDIQTQLMAAFSASKIQLLVASRPSKYLEAKIPASHRYQVYAQDEDIDCLIQRKISENPTFKALLAATPSLRNEIVYAIRNKAAGMFLHASFQLARLQGCETVDDLRDELARVPPDVSGLYADTWNRVIQAEAPKANRGKAILLWTVFTARPLCVEDLQCAVMLSEHRGIDREFAIPDHSLVSLCHGLITVERESRTVLLVHSTARDALRLLLLDVVPDPHSHLAAACMSRLRFCGFLKADIHNEEKLARLFEENRLLEYAYESWSYHVRRCIESTETRESVLDFLASSSSFPVRMSRYRDFHSDFSPVHLAAWYNLPRHITLLVGMAYKTDKQSPTGRWTPLMAAAYQGHSTVASELIQSSRTRSSAASRYLMIWKSLQNHLRKASQGAPGSGVNAVNERGHTSLMLAAMMGHVIVVKLLLDAGAQLNIVDHQGYSALMSASLRGHLPVVRILLWQPNLHVNLRCSKGDTALFLALENQHVDVVKALLQHPKIDLNGRDGQDRTPLILASMRGRVAMVLTLLEAPRTQVNLIDSTGMNALMYASRNSYPEVVEILLRVPGIKVNCQDNEGKTALIRASITGSVKVVKALLRAPDIDVNVADYKGWTALGWARMLAYGEVDWITAVDEEACQKVVELLLQFKENAKVKA